VTSASRRLGRLVVLQVGAARGTSPTRDKDQPEMSECPAWSAFGGPWGGSGPRLRDSGGGFAARARTAGTLVSPGGSPINTLVQLSPIYVTFNPSEADLAEIRQAKAAGSIATDIVVSKSDQERRSGELTFLDNIVDHSTGTIVARATIANFDLSILPGQYVHVRISLREIPDALMVPQTAIGSSQLGKYVYIVGHENKVEQRLVSLGPSDGDLVAVLTGVSEGDGVISDRLISQIFR
jgi:membrane fusion protein, multidrug efflux system